MSRMLKSIGLFCKRALQKRPIFCKQTYVFKHPTNRSHPIAIELLFYGSSVLVSLLGLFVWVSL